MRPTQGKLYESIDKLTLGVSEELYPHVWRLIYEIEGLGAEVGQLKEALNFYAKEETYSKEFEDAPPPIDLDGGQVARKALRGGK